jgi:hypothetical protein
MDDIVFGGSSNSLVARFANDMSRVFEMSMMGELQFFLELQIKQSNEGTFVHQAKYTKHIVRKFKMEDSKAMATPMSTTTALDADEESEHLDQKEYRSMIGSLFYMTATRPDIQFSVCLCARFQASPRTSHRQAVKRLFRYLRHTPNFGLWYSASSSLALHGFSDADFVGCWLDRKSTSANCLLLGSSLLSWSSRKQSNVAQSTTEAEYVAAASCCSQLLWVTYTMSDFGEEYNHVPLQCDSTSAISVTKNPVLHSKTKDIEDSFDPCTHRCPTSPYFHQTPRSSNFHSFAGGAWCVIDFLSWCVGASLLHMYSFPLCISCISHGICNMMYRHPRILDCMHFVSYALVKKSFSYIHCSPRNDIYVFVSLFGMIWLVWISS